MRRLAGHVAVGVLGLRARREGGPRLQHILALLEVMACVSVLTALVLCGALVKHHTCC